MPDSQVKTIMFENGEADIYTFVDEPTWAAAAADPNHYFHDKLRPIGNAGVWFTIPLLDMAPMEDLFVRKSLAQAADMQTIISAVMGPLTRKATGYISPTLPCGNPAARGTYTIPTWRDSTLANRPTAVPRTLVFSRWI